MRKSRKEAAETRERIVSAASEEFRRHGVNGTGLADLMGAAGLTHGGFYKHFESKEQVVAEALAAASESLLDELSQVVSATSGTRGLHAAIARYLSIEHRDHPGEGCPFVAMASELARGGDVVRETATKAFLNLVELIASRLEGLSPAAAKKEAITMLSTMIGAMTMARIVDDPDLSATILRQAYKRLTQAA